MLAPKSSYSQAVVWVLGLGISASLAGVAASHSVSRPVLEGTQGWGKRVFPKPSAGIPGINVLEVDVWRHSLEDGTLRPIPKLPLARQELIRTQQFSPELYRQQMGLLDGTYSKQRDVLMYYGGVPTRRNRHGLNFNAWSMEDLQRLRAEGRRPFIGLETMEPKALEWLARRLQEAGYGPSERIYVRICSEPSGSWYGSEDGTRTGRRNTPAAYAAYQRRFAGASAQILRLNRHYRLQIHRVFAGTNAKDFDRYMPSPELFDAIGYDLYATPENKEKTLRLIDTLRRRLPGKPLVIPELGIATAGPGASPRWAQETLGEILMLLAKHPAGAPSMTVFSVNVANRMPQKRWSWAWTPLMFDMLKEWEAAPRRWKRDGFHRYDPMSYSIGRDVLYVDRPDLRIVYRKLPTFKSPGVPWFHEVRFTPRANGWHHTTRRVTLDR